MHNHNYSFPHSLSRSSSQQYRQLNNENIHNQHIKNIEKANRQIKIYQPFQRLERRRIFQKIWRQNFSQNATYLKYDTFAVFDAVAKRGGFNRVCAQERWEQIGLCLCLDKKLWNFSLYYHDIVLPHESKLLAMTKWYYPEQIYTSEVLEIYLLANNNLTPRYFQLSPSEQMFWQANFFSIDEYFNIKSIFILCPDIRKMSIEYADKFMMLRKWMLFNSQYKNVTPHQLKMLCILPNHENKVLIVGLSLQTLIIADKLSECGLNVTVIDYSNNSDRYKDDYVVQNGLVMLEGGKQQGSYYHFLSSNGVVMEQINNINIWIQQGGNVLHEQTLRKSEEHFLSILNQLRQQIMNKKRFYEELMSRVIRRKLQHLRVFIKWHYDRHMLFNRIKGQYTTISDLVNYEAKKYTKHLVQPNLVVVIKNWSKLFQKVNSRKNVQILNHNLETIMFNNGEWHLKSREGVISGKYLIYGDHEAIYKTILEGNPRLPGIGSDIMGDTVSLLHQLTTLKYVNCLYKFRDRIIFRQNIGINLTFTLWSIHGYVYYTIMPNGYEVIAQLRCHPHANNNFYKLLFDLLSEKCLAKGNRLVEPQQWSFEHSFSMKDQKNIEALIRIKQNQKMFLMLPLTSVNSPHRLQSNIDTSNMISNIILEDAYPQYALYQSSLKTSFIKYDGSDKIQEESSINQGKQESFQGKKCQNIIQNSSQIKQIRFNNTQIDVMTINTVEKNALAIEIQRKDKFDFANYQLNQDAFGLCNPIIKSYQSYAKGKIQNCDQLRQAFQDIWQFEVNQPLLLDQNIYLYTFGQPYFDKIQFTNQNKPKAKKQSIFLLNGFVTRRQHVSLYNILKGTIFYQSIAIVDQIIFYCFIDEIQPTCIYYHPNLKLLISKLNSILVKQRKIYEQNNIQLPEIQKYPITTYPPQHLSLTYLRQSIKKDISNAGQSIDYDQILEKKISILFNCTKKTIDPLYSKGHQNSKIIEQLFDINTNIITIISQLNQYLRVILKISQLKQFSLSDMFFGYLNQKYFCCQILKRFSKRPLQLNEIKSKDAALFTQISQILEKNGSLRQFDIQVEIKPGVTTIYRNFCHRTISVNFEAYGYRYQLGEKLERHFLILGKQQIKFDKKDEILIYIFKNLNVNHHTSEIIKKFKQMIMMEIKKLKILSPKLKLYFRMTRMKSKLSNIDDAPRIREQLKQMSNNQRQNVISLMKNNKLRFIDNDFVLIIR